MVSWRPESNYGGPATMTRVKKMDVAHLDKVSQESDDQGMASKGELESRSISTFVWRNSKSGVTNSCFSLSEASMMVTESKGPQTHLLLKIFIMTASFISSSHESMPPHSQTKTTGCPAKHSPPSAADPAPSHLPPSLPPPPYNPLSS